MGTQGTSTKTAHYGYITDVSGIKFDDATESSWIQLMPLGEYSHQMHGQISITPNKVQKFVDNFRQNIRGIPLDVDYDHKQHTGKAAGWIQDVQDRGFDGLWGLVRWTPPAIKSLKDGEYKYFSPEFVDEWEHPQNGTFENVLLGGAITNRPFLKDIQPINLHEVIRASEGGPVVDPKKLRQMLGLPEDATDEAVEAKLTELASKGEAPPTDPPASPPGDGDNAGTGGTPPATPAKPEPVLASEQNSQVVQLTETVAAMQKQLNEQAAARRLSEVKLGFLQLTEGKKFALSPAVVNKAQQLTVQLSEDRGNAFMGLLKEILDGGLIELGERGGSRTDPAAGSGDVVKQFSELVDKQTNDGKISYIDAVEKAAAMHPDLYNQYRAAQLTQGGV